MIKFGLILWHINHFGLFNVKSSLYLVSYPVRAEGLLNMITVSTSPSNTLEKDINPTILPPAMGKK